MIRETTTTIKTRALELPGYILCKNSGMFEFIAESYTRFLMGRLMFEPFKSDSDPADEFLSVYSWHRPVFFCWDRAGKLLLPSFLVSHGRRTSS